MPAASSSTPASSRTRKSSPTFLEPGAPAARAQPAPRPAAAARRHYSPPALTNEASQFLETKKESKYELASLWNMPGHMVGLMDRATFSNIEQQSIEYVVHTLGPWIAAIEQSAERDLLIGEDQDRYFVEFNVSGLLRGDIKTRWAAYAQGRQWGWLSSTTSAAWRTWTASAPPATSTARP
jgi:HK97 family phage portal protein